jgi:uncharacterized protein YabN with tetrapyrrole methylase and pyrophosphatase domain
VSLPKNLNQFTTVVDIIARLRAPDGCPWDRKQTHASLRKNLLQECYEIRGIRLSYVMNWVTC